MTAVADETEEPAGSSRRRDAVWTVAAALAGLGVVVDAAVLIGQPLSPVIATFMNLRGVQARTVLFVVAGTVAGLVLLRWWRWLLLAGSLLALPVSTPALPWPGGQWAAYAALAGAPLAVLAAALAVIILGVAGSLRPRGRDAPAPSPGPWPGRQGS
jgi:hypothetical protein